MILLLNDLNNQQKASLLCLEGILYSLKKREISGRHYDFDNLRNIDYELIKVYWALENRMKELCELILFNPKGILNSIIFIETEKIGEISGILNTNKTVIRQATTQNPAIFVIDEPTESFSSDPNYLVTWVLKEALDILISLRKTNVYVKNDEHLNEMISSLENALKNEAFADILIRNNLRKPNPSIVRATGKLKNLIYRKSVELYYLYEDIESKQEEVVKDFINNSLIAYFDYWQRLEIGSALFIGKAISNILEEKLEINFPIKYKTPLCKVGDFEIYWQYAIENRPLENLDSSEKLNREIIESLGVRVSKNRADIAVCYKDNLVSLVECKYFETGSVNQAIQDASSQLVRYARDINPTSKESVLKLLELSIIIVANRFDKYPAILNKEDNKFLFFLDMQDILENNLENWARELIALFT